VARAPLPHRVSAHGTMRDLGAEIDCQVTLLDGVEVLRKALPLPGDALRQSGTRDVLDALHQFDQPLLTTGTHRREPDAAVAADDGRDAMQAGRLQRLVPADLTVVVRVDVDEAGCHDPAGGVAGGARLALEPRAIPVAAAHLYDAAILDADV